MSTPTTPAAVITASEELAKIRQAIARQNQADAANKSQLAAAESEHVRASADAALDGTPAPKVSAALKSLREQAETSAAVLADLVTREIAAKGAFEDATLTWAWGIVREQIAADVTHGRTALIDFAAASRRLIDALGDNGAHLAKEVLNNIPSSIRFARIERLGAYNGIFGSVGSRNPAQDIGPGMLIEAGCPSGDEARRLAQAPPSVSVD